MPSTSLAALLAAAASALVATTTKQHLSCIAAARSLQSPQPGAYGSHTGDAAAAEDTPNVADYVIVGGGTAGCVLAARLCENLPDSSIVLLERAAPRTEREDLFVRSPRLFSELWGAPERSLLDVWETKPNAGLGGRKVTQLSGRTLGGSSAINGLQWTKPPLATFNGAKWAFSGLSLQLNLHPWITTPCMCHVHKCQCKLAACCTAQSKQMGSFVLNSTSGKSSYVTEVNGARAHHIRSAVHTLPTLLAHSRRHWYRQCTPKPPIAEDRAHRWLHVALAARGGSSRRLPSLSGLDSIPEQCWKRIV